MGKSNRFKPIGNEITPGPNQYKIAGFADEIMKKTFNKSNMNKTTAVDTKNNFFKTGDLERQSSKVSEGKEINNSEYKDIKPDNSISKHSKELKEFKEKKLSEMSGINLKSNKNIKVVSKHGSENSLELNINNFEEGLKSEYFENKNNTKSNFYKPSSKNTLQSNNEHEDLYMDVSSNKDSINC